MTTSIREAHRQIVSMHAQLATMAQIAVVMPRRRFLTGLGGLLAAPAVVKIDSLMPVKALRWPHVDMSQQLVTSYDRAAVVAVQRLSDALTSAVFIRYDEYDELIDLKPLYSFLTDLRK